MRGRSRRPRSLEARRLPERLLPLQPQARPAFEIDALAQMKALRAPGAQHAGNVGEQQAGDDRLAVARP